MPEPLKLFLEHPPMPPEFDCDPLDVRGADHVGYACATCGLLFPATKLRTMEELEAHARACCALTCPDCGGPTPQKWMACRTCWDRRESQRRLARFEKAEHITQADWDGPVYDDFTSRYYEDTDAFWESAWGEDPESVPDFVWACSTHLPQLDVRDILEHLEESCELDDSISLRDHLNGLEELKAAIETFNAAQDWRYWHCDERRAVLVERPVE